MGCGQSTAYVGGHRVSPEIVVTYIVTQGKNHVRLMICGIQRGKRHWAWVPKLHNRFLKHPDLVIQRAHVADGRGLLLTENGGGKVGESGRISAPLHSSYTMPNCLTSVHLHTSTHVRIHMHTYTSAHRPTSNALSLLNEHDSTAEIIGPGLSHSLHQQRACFCFWVVTCTCKGACTVQQSASSGIVATCYEVFCL